MSQRAKHWEQVYATKAASDVSWYEPEPATSLRLIEAAAATTGSSVIDVGGGASLLVDRLLDHGFRDLAVLDIAQHALDDVRARLGARAANVTFVCADVVSWVPERRYDIWHDRAVLHFLTDPAERDRYVAIAGQTVLEGGALIVGTFADDGPTHCSGLSVVRYTTAHLADLFAPSFELVAEQRVEHLTPARVGQPFTWVVLRRA